MKFGNQKLQQFTRNEDQFQFELRTKLDHIRQCIIDNIWNIPMTPGTSNLKIAIINALSNYFITTVQKPVGKKFSCYAIFSWTQQGVYGTWEEVKQATERLQNQVFMTFRKQ